MIFLQQNLKSFPVFIENLKIKVKTVNLNDFFTEYGREYHPKLSVFIRNLLMSVPAPHSDLHDLTKEIRARRNLIQ